MYDGLKQQLNPHFLFTAYLTFCVNRKRSGNGEPVLSQMSDMYRYIPQKCQWRDGLFKEELNFVETYIGLQNPVWQWPGLSTSMCLEDYGYKNSNLATLQNMMENAIKHNIIDRDALLVIDIYHEDGYLVVKQPYKPKQRRIIQ